MKISDISPKDKCRFGRQVFSFTLDAEGQHYPGTVQVQYIFGVSVIKGIHWTMRPSEFLVRQATAMLHVEISKRTFVDRLINKLLPKTVITLVETTKKNYVYSLVVYVGYSRSYRFTVMVYPYRMDVIISDFVWFSKGPWFPDYLRIRAAVEDEFTQRMIDEM